MRRVYYLSLLVCLSMIAVATIGRAQSTDRRGTGSSVSTGYFIVDSDDNAPAPWRPTYFFMDTTYLPSQWNKVWTGPQQNAPQGKYFFDPTHLTQPSLMDTLNDCMVGPIWMGLSHHWNFYAGNYDSVYFSSNGFIGFLGYSYATTGTPPPYATAHRTDLGTSAGYGSAPHAIIAALWTDLDIRHGGANDTSKIYYYTSVTADTFIVNYYNFRLRPSTAVNALPPGFSFTNIGADKLYCKKFQIVLANSDSSIQINYGGFTGGINGFPPLLAYSAWGDNVSIGLTNESGSQGTGVLYGPKGGANATSSGWEAVNKTCKTCNQGWNQDKQWAIKYKRWHDKVAAVQVDFPTRNYEICLGSSVTPKAQFKNVDSVTNTFKCRFSIRNAVTGVAVYSRVVSLIGMLPGATKDTTFSPYTTNPNVVNELGTFNACAIATTFDTADVNIGDQWPFDDTVCTSIFGIRRTAVPFFDPSDGYSKTVSADIPDQTLWVSIGATVLDGETYTWDPPPPRYPNGVGVGQDNYVSPVILMDNTDVNGLPYGASKAGDTLVSFPINLQGKPSANLTFDFQRAGKFLGQFQFPWDNGSMYGPEWTILDVNTGAVDRPGDSLLLEFKDPGQPGCNPSPSTWHKIAGIDGGRDFEFKKFFMSLNTGKINVDGLALSQVSLANYFTADFRFRLRLQSFNDGPSIPPPTDDNDPWYIDNPTVLVPLKPEIEVMWVRVVEPYTKLPASQAISLPVYVKIANLSTNVEIAFPIRVQILDPNGNTVYWQAVVVNSLNAGTDTVIKMPNWNAQDASQGGSAVFTVDAWLDQPNFSSPSNITGTYTQFALNVDINTDGGVQEFAYDAAGLDPGLNSGNDWPGLVGLPGEGVGFINTSGSFAMKFTVATEDTFYGIRAFFGDANQAPDYIRLTLLSGSPGSCTPEDTLQQQGVQATMEAQRGGSGQNWNQFVEYFFPKPIVLQSNGAEKGVFWIGVSQLGVVNMSLGADLSRGGGITRGYDPFFISPNIEPAYDDPYGTEYVSGGSKANDGDISCAWAVEATALSNGWAQWTPSQGWWPTMSSVGPPWSQILAWTVPGMVPFTNVSGTLSCIEAGTYTPSIRAMVSQQGMLPVQLVYLNGEQQNGSAVLTWATANESNNAGFTVQRKIANSQDIYENLGFVAAKEKNSTTETGYGYIDRNVNPGTYSYRLLQTDVNGAQHLSNEVQVSIDAPNGFSLEQNYPNPFTPVLGSTMFSYTTTLDAPATLIIYNQLGEVVKILVNGEVGQGIHTVRWDGKDASGNPVTPGSYICKLVSGENSSTIKVSVTP